MVTRGEGSDQGGIKTQPGKVQIYRCDTKNLVQTDKITSMRGYFFSLTWEYNTERRHMQYGRANNATVAAVDFVR